MALVTVQRSPSSSDSPTTIAEGLGSEQDEMDTNRSPKSLSECYFAGKGTALVLPDAEAQKFNRRSGAQGSNIQKHLQSMFYLLRPEETLKMAVKLESNYPARTRYLVVVSRMGSRGEESCLLGIDCNEKTTVGLVLKVLVNTNIRLDGDGGFSVSVCGKDHIFKPVSVQAMWSALQTLHKASKKARDENYFEAGSTHGWVDYYENKIESDRSCLNEWHAMDNLESRRPPSPDSNRNKPTEREQTETVIRSTLKEIMMSVDLDEVTSKYIRTRLEEDFDMDLADYKPFIDQEMLTILGQMDSPTEIFDHVYLGSEWNASNFEELRKNGVGHILNVSKEIDNFFPGTFDYLNIRVYDDETTDLLKYWDDTFKYITKARNEGSKVLVHCKMGVSRSASVVIAYAMKAFNWDFKKAWTFVKDKRSCIKPNTSFLTQLEIYRGILDAMKNKEKLQRSKSETNLNPLIDAAITKNGKVLVGSEPTPVIQAMRKAYIDNLSGQECKQMKTRPKSWSPDNSIAKELMLQTSKSSPVFLSLEELSPSREPSPRENRKSFLPRHMLMPRDNGESYSVSPNRIFHLPGRYESVASTVKDRVTEFENSEKKKSAINLTQNFDCAAVNQIDDGNKSQTTSRAVPNKNDTWDPGERFAASGENLAVSGEKLSATEEKLSVSRENLSVSRENLSVSGEGLSVSGEGLSVFGEILSVSGEILSVSGEILSVSGEKLSVSGKRRTVSEEKLSVSKERLPEETFSSVLREKLPISGEKISVSGEKHTPSGENLSLCGDMSFNMAQSENCDSSEVRTATVWTSSTVIKTMPEPQFALPLSALNNCKVPGYSLRTKREIEKNCNSSSVDRTTSSDPFSKKLDMLFDNEEKKEQRLSVIPVLSVAKDDSMAKECPSRQNSWSSYDSAVVMGCPSEVLSRHSSWGSGDTRTLPSRNSSWGSYDIHTRERGRRVNEKGEEVLHRCSSEKSERTSGETFSNDNNDSTSTWKFGAVGRLKTKSDPTIARDSKEDIDIHDIKKDVTHNCTDKTCAISKAVDIPLADKKESNSVVNVSGLSISAPASSSEGFSAKEFPLSRCSSNSSTIEIDKSSRTSARKMFYLDSLHHKNDFSYFNDSNSNFYGMVRNLKREFEAKTSTGTKSDSNAGQIVTKCADSSGGVAVDATTAPTKGKNGNGGSNNSCFLAVADQKNWEVEKKPPIGEDLNMKNLIGIFENQQRETNQINNIPKYVSNRPTPPIKNSRYSCIEMSSAVDKSSPFCIAPTTIITNLNKTNNSFVDTGLADTDYNKRPPISPVVRNVVAASVIASAARKQQQQFGKSHPLARLNIKPRHNNPVYNTM